MILTLGKIHRSSVVSMGTKGTMGVARSVCLSRGRGRVAITLRLGVGAEIDHGRS